VLNGTGKAAQLDFTYSAGKTGTSSGYRDAWFIGFTGQYVVGVWLGNDDFTPMSRVTGGSFPAQTWHNFLVLAHDTDNIPPIPGIAPHPVQVAEQERLAAIQKAAASNADTDTEVIIAAPTAESVKDMSSMTRQILESLSTRLKEAPALQPSDTTPQNRAEAPASTPTQTASDSQPSTAAKPAEASPGQATETPVAAGSQTGATLPP
jgi:penicillin-binding protein 1A